MKYVEQSTTGGLKRTIASFPETLRSLPLTPSIPPSTVDFFMRVDLVCRGMWHIICSWLASPLYRYMSRGLNGMSCTVSYVTPYTSCDQYLELGDTGVTTVLPWTVPVPVQDPVLYLQKNTLYCTVGTYLYLHVSHSCTVGCSPLPPLGFERLFPDTFLFFELLEPSQCAIVWITGYCPSSD